MNTDRTPTQDHEHIRERPKLRAFVHGLIFSVLLVLSFPPFSLWCLSFLTPVPLMLLAARGRATPLIALFAALGTTPAWIVTHNWVFLVSSYGAPLLIIYISIYPGAFVYVASRITSQRVPKWAVLALAWCASEFARANVLGGYAWYLSMHPIIDAPGVIVQGPARLGGATLVGLLLACLAAVIAQVIRTRNARALVPAAVGVVVLWIALGAAAVSLDPEHPDEIVVGIVQPNIPQSNRLEWTERQRFSDWEELAELTFISARDPDLTPDLIVWPEGLTPGWTFDPISLETERDAGYGWKMTPRFDEDAPDLVGVPSSIPATQAVDEVLEFQRRLGIPLVVGGPAFDDLRIVKVDNGLIEYQNNAQYNSVFVVRDGAVDPVWYNKMHLTPFGETMPLISRSEWLEEQLLGIAAGGMSFTLTAGESPTVLSAASVQIAAPVCFEGTVPQVCRELVFEGGERKAQVLINISNDGWFMHWDPGRRAHMQNARWRALELATPLVRSANTGVSCVVDTWGRVVEDEIAPLARDPRSGYINARIGLGAGATPYAFIGESVGYAVCTAVAAMLLWSIRKIRKDRDTQRDPDQKDG